jgi:hypothetical protein
LKYPKAHQNEKDTPQKHRNDERPLKASKITTMPQTFGIALKLVKVTKKIN